MGITCKQTGKFRGMMRKIENEQLKIKADSVKRKKKDGKKMLDITILEYEWGI